MDRDFLSLAHLAVSPTALSRARACLVTIGPRDRASSYIGWAWWGKLHDGAGNFASLVTSQRLIENSKARNVNLIENT